MQFIDKAIVEISSGKGGNGIASFRREKYVPRGGPDGGDGGKGGDVIIEGDAKMSTLRDFKYKKYLKAGDGIEGKKRKQHGADGKDLIIKVPLGTLVKTLPGEELICDVVNPQDRFLILKGGRGGLGNTNFKSSTNQVPFEFTRGKPGATMKISLELNLIADVGFIGFPNAGKSTLLSALSSAKPKIANYPFTTLIPNLGIYEDLRGFRISFADIPGIVKDAHLGKGLGLEFLRHISRTRILLFILDGTGKDLLNDFNVLSEEIKNFDNRLFEKNKLVVVNKIDLLDQNPGLDIEEDIVYVSALMRLNIDKLLERIMQIYKEITGTGGH
ncbi:GTPase ObgE [candidate division WOR-3 bacterium]|nr:GTPase ObgE [candidate division WOR-3 bacterium]